MDKRLHSWVRYLVCSLSQAAPYVTIFITNFFFSTLCTATYAATLLGRATAVLAKALVLVELVFVYRLHSSIIMQNLAERLSQQQMLLPPELKTKTASLCFPFLQTLGHWVATTGIIKLTEPSISEERADSLSQ